MSTVRAARRWIHASGRFDRVPVLMGTVRAGRRWIHASGRFDRVPVLMGTVRAGRRWIHASGRTVSVERSQLILVGCACAALFACFFAIGRAVSPGGVPREAGLPGFTAKSASTAVPLRLSSAPAIEPGASARALASAPAAGRALSSPNVLAAQAPVAAAPSTRQGGTEVASTPASTPASTQPQAAANPTPAVAPQQPSAGVGSPAASSKPSGRTGGSSTTKSGGGGTSFDSSG